MLAPRIGGPDSALRVPRRRVPPPPWHSSRASSSRSSSAGRTTPPPPPTDPPSSRCRPTSRPSAPPRPRALRQPGIRPLDQRKTRLVTMGDSEISGEGVGNYVPGTHQDGNWCDRSYDQAVFRTGIASDAQYNIACSGATPWNLIAGGPTQHNELNQGDNLRDQGAQHQDQADLGGRRRQRRRHDPVRAGRHRLRARPGALPGPCYPHVHRRVDDPGRGQPAPPSSRRSHDIKQTMTDAGYLASRLRAGLQSYPSPGEPGRRGQPQLPRLVLAAAACSTSPTRRSRATRRCRCSSAALRQAAANTGTRYLDASRLFHGHEVCTDNTMVRGLYIEVGDLERERRPPVVPPQRPRPRHVRRVHDRSSATPGFPQATLRRPGQHRRTARSTTGCWSSSSCATPAPANASTARATTHATARRSSRTPATAGETRASGTTRRGSRCTASCPTTGAWTSPAAR